MKIEVLVSAMHQSDLSLFDKMNLQTDAIIINQCDEMKLCCDNINGNDVRMFSSTERGVGRSRNQAIIHATGDICIFADEDLVFVDGYEQIVINAFNKFKDAEAILFRLDVTNSPRPVDIIKKDKKMKFTDAAKYGIPALAIRHDSLLKNNLWFSLLFGGGAIYGSGEDTIFFADIIKKKMKAYVCKDKISEAEASESTWFEGFNDKYFFDKGVLYGALLGRKAKISVIISAWRWYKKLKKEKDYWYIVGLMEKGVDEFLK